MERRKWGSSENWVSALNKFPIHIKGKEPDRVYTISATEADRLGYYPDSRGHRDDRVKLPNHPTHPSRGIFVGNQFQLPDRGMEDPNYSIYGLVDNGDGYAIPTYQGTYVIPEITVTPNQDYYFNSYDNIKLVK